MYCVGFLGLAAAGRYYIETMVRELCNPYHLLVLCIICRFGIGVIDSRLCRLATHTQTHTQMQEDPPNYYSILDLNINCDFADIKRAYRAASLKMHPDHSGFNFVL